MGAIKLSEAEICKRLPVWEALSSLYLDTDTRLFEEKIISVLAASPYSIEELDDILAKEVHPVCRWNIIWWEWAGFDREWLQKKIITRLNSPLADVRSILASYRKAIYHLSPQWLRIRSGIRMARQGNQS